MDTRVKPAYDHILPLTLRSSFSPKLPPSRIAAGRSLAGAVLKSASAANLKFLSVVPRLRHRNFKFEKPR
jgi:hypothetical protein